MSLTKLFSGRKRESSVWEYFEYVEADNKSRCGVLNDKGEPCGVRIAGIIGPRILCVQTRFHSFIHSLSVYWTLWQNAKCFTSIQSILRELNMINLNYIVLFVLSCNLLIRKPAGYFKIKSLEMVSTELNKN